MCGEIYPELLNKTFTCAGGHVKNLHLKMSDSIISAPSLFQHVHIIPGDAKDLNYLAKDFNHHAIFLLIICIILPMTTMTLAMI